METPTTLSPEKPNRDYSSLVDTSRPFRSVKEAVAIFGERILVREIYSPKPYYTPPTPTTQDHAWMFSSPTTPVSTINPNKEYDHENNSEFFDTLKKLETELEETKVELKLLKERESETEIAVASLNAELHKNMSKLAEAEAAAAAKKGAAMSRRVSFETGKKEGAVREEEKKRETLIRMESSSSLAHILSLGEEKKYLRGKKEKKEVTKKKPIVPLLGDLFFFRKKGSSNKTLNNNPLYASPHGVF
ncbi:WEB family protein At3g51220 [Ricinus communis]|uniref:WEB family protein n=1 Tax=Ricinus communis TaxID=3988 RepID=B9SSN1_RICCO|nr:WEB family protein At3g51220 [Ricinus communis]EEF33370.1 hypothetical protein RCOM_1374370 [Ricinus communis]|eukprot:XP_002529000.1 WEB family protein At3g51220 [Ricinus communis]